LNDRNTIGGVSDDNRQLSPAEIKLVDYCWDQYTSNGSSHTFDIPSYYLP
jgi:hypothetical protein